MKNRSISDFVMAYQKATKLFWSIKLKLKCTVCCGKYTRYDTEIPPSQNVLNFFIDLSKNQERIKTKTCTISQFYVKALTQFETEKYFQGIFSQLLNKNASFSSRPILQKIWQIPFHGN